MKEKDSFLSWTSVVLCFKAQICQPKCLTPTDTRLQHRKKDLAWTVEKKHDSDWNTLRTSTQSSRNSAI